MKIIKFYFLIYIIVLSSCDKPVSFEVTRIIKNDTGYKITLKVFSEDLIVKDFVINQNDSLVDKETCDAGPILWNCPLTWTPDIDSVSVIFDSIKSITYCVQQTNGVIQEECYVNGKNIIGFNFDGSNNNHGYEEVSKKVFVFTITDEDYQFAEDIGG